MHSRRLLLSLILLFSVALSPAIAQIPRTISFQGVLADAQGNLIPDGPQDLTITIYDAATGGNTLFSETLRATVVRGVFNAVIGSSDPAGIPATVAFDNQYWLGVRIGSAAELAPRTPFTSVPYALNAVMAQRAIVADRADTATWANAASTSDTTANIRGGHVVSVNGQQGTIEILGAGATTITRSGNQFVIRSTDTSGGGIRRIDNFDGSLVVDPPQGPFVTLFIREGGVQTHHYRDLSITTQKIIDQQITTRTIADAAVTNPKIANNAVTASKVNTEGAPDGYALISDGSLTPVWENPITANIPFAGVFNEAVTLWSLTNQGTGASGYFAVDNPANTTDALTGITNGVGGTGIFGEYSATTGLGTAIRGESNSEDAGAIAILGHITSTTPGAFSSGIRGVNSGTGGLGIGVYGSQDGSGWGVYGVTPGGIGVIGSSSSGTGVYGAGGTGTGVYGTSTTGSAGRFDIANNASTAIALSTETNGTGDAFSAINSGTSGRAGHFQITDATNISTGVEVSTAGTGWGLTASRGPSNIFTGPGGILGESSNGAGVVGFSNSANGMIAASVTGNGLLSIAFGASAVAVDAQAIGNNGIGVRSLSLSGPAASFQTLGGTADAVSIANGGTGRSLFVNHSNAANTLPAIEATSAGSGTTIVGANTGTGSAGTFRITNAASTAVALNVATNGIGGGINVQLTNAASGGRGIDVAHAGVGTGVFATSAGGMAIWGIASAISAAGVLGDNTFGEAVVGRNRGGVGVGAVVGRNDSSGYGVRGFNTMNGIGVLGQAGISGGTGVGGRFENVNAASGGDALQATTNGTGWAGAFTSTNNSTAGRGVSIATVAAAGGTALQVANGAVAVSYDAGWTSGSIVDDAVLVLNAGGNSALPIPTVDGTTVWVVNNSGVAAGISNVTVGPYAIAAGRAVQFIYVSAVSAVNWVPVQ